MNKQVEAVRPENEELAEKIISQMKAGVDRWEMPWHKGIVEAINVLTGPGSLPGTGEEHNAVVQFVCAIKPVSGKAMHAFGGVSPPKNRGCARKGGKQRVKPSIK